VLAVIAVLLGACGNDAGHEAPIVRITTAVAGANVVTPNRDTTRTCALPTGPDQPSGVHSVAGTLVPADPERIIVLDTAALDAACTLGLWHRVVGAAAVPGLSGLDGRPENQPTYLGTGIAEIPAVGPIGNPDLSRIAALKPDLILGTAAATPTALRAIAPTVLVGDVGGWQQQFAALADALDRAGQVDSILADYHTDARDTGASIAAQFTQASVIRFSGTNIQVQGADSFAGEVLADARVQRPAAQRGPSYNLSGLGSWDEQEKVEGDLIYVMFQGPDGHSAGEKTMHGNDWKSLQAVSDNRQFVVDDSIWHGDGVTAARALLDDLRSSLNTCSC
jgi:iron complex transport system substrate-binding protein